MITIYLSYNNIYMHVYTSTIEDNDTSDHRNLPLSSSMDTYLQPDVELFATSGIFHQSEKDFPDTFMRENMISKEHKNNGTTYHINQIIENNDEEDEDDVIINISDRIIVVKDDSIIQPSKQIHKQSLDQRFLHLKVRTAYDSEDDYEHDEEDYQSLQKPSRMFDDSNLPHTHISPTGLVTPSTQALIQAEQGGIFLPPTTCLD